MIRVRKVLNARQLVRAKYSLGIFIALLGLQTIVANAAYYYNGDSFEQISVQQFPRGRIVEFTDKDKFCHR